jgi:predicted Holliday junction resolvase-like endonuclease
MNAQQLEAILIVIGVVAAINVVVVARHLDGLRRDFNEKARLLEERADELEQRVNALEWDRTAKPRERG